MHVSTSSMPSRTYLIRPANAVPTLGFAFVGLVIWLRYFPSMNAVEFITYRNAAIALLHGHSPYPAVAGGAIAGGHAFVYPLLTAIAFTPFGLLPLHLGVLLYRIGLFVALYTAGMIMGSTKGITQMTLALWATPTITALQVGSLEPIFLLLIVLAWRYWRRLIASGVIIGSVAVAKLYLAPLLLPILLARRLTRSLSAGIAVGVWVPVVLLLLPGIGTYLHIVTHLSAHEASSGWSFQSAVTPVFGRGHVGAFIGAAIALLLMAPGIKRDWSHARETTNWRPEPRTLGRYVIIALIASPIVWSHYYLLVVVLMLGSQGMTPVALFTLVTWVIVTPDTVASSGRWFGLVVGGVGLIAALWSTRMHDRQTNTPKQSWTIERWDLPGVLSLGAALAATGLIVASVMSSPGVAGAGIAQLSLVTYLLYDARVTRSFPEHAYPATAVTAPPSSLQ
jgi:hypothetical protein